MGEEGGRSKREVHWGKWIRQVKPTILLTIPPISSTIISTTSFSFSFFLSFSSSFCSSFFVSFSFSLFCSQMVNCFSRKDKISERKRRRDVC